MVGKAILALVATAILTAACSSTGGDRVSTPASTPGTTTSAVASSSPTREQSPIPTTARAACRKLVHSDALSSAAGFVIVAGVVNPGDVDETVVDLQAAASVAPPAMARQMQRVIDVLEAIDARATAGDGRTIDTSAMQPAGRRIIAACLQGHFPVPHLF